MEAKFKRDIVFVGHAHCGKTSLAESMLFAAGATVRKGDVQKGSTVTDFNEDEIERQNSINSGLIKLIYNKHQIQGIDTPGYSDFVGETIAALRAVDGAIVVVDGSHGVEVGTEDVWQRLEALNLPRLIFINKTDKEDAKVEETIASIKEQLSPKACVVDMNDPKFIEAVAETDDQLIEKYFEAGTLSEKEVKDALHKAVSNGIFFPIVKGSALKDEGIKELLDEIIVFLPSPLEAPATQAKISNSEEMKEIIPSEDGPLAAFVFKAIADPHIGQLSIARVISGKLKANSSFFNSNTSNKETVSTISMLQGREQVHIPEAGCGDIIAIPKLKKTHVNNTICDGKEHFIFSPIIFPEPSISSSVKPKTRVDEEKIAVSLHRLCEEDPTFQIHRDNDTNELIVAGMGDLHLKIMIDRMKSRYHVDVDLGTPRVSYRETITRKGAARHKYKKQSGGRGQYGDVGLEIEPLPHDGPDFEFVDKIFGGAIPKNFIPSVEKGVRKAFKEGILAGYPMMNVRVKVVDGSYHDVDSSDMAFQLAGAMAFRDAIKTASPVLLEPIMDVSIVIPDEFVGQVTKDVSSRRGKIMGSETRGKKQIIKAHMPLAEMFKYATDLRSATAGRGSFTMRFFHYEKAPDKVSQQVIAEKQQAKKE
ncbi:MAG: elongation factor G [Candidatus Aceula meridiana]|nr:elongation factor G [Candidatus Aceula meridiana]